MTGHGWAEKYPFLGTEPIETSKCVSREAWEEEREKVFKKVWLIVGRTEEIPDQGDYKVKRLDFARTSAILIRGKDGRVRAFHNVCSHRGNKVVVERGNETFGGRRTGLIFCRFHGWSFDAFGNLVNVPQEQGFYGSFCKKDNGLAPIHCDVWAGFIFINLASQPKNTLLEFLGEYAAVFGEFPYHEIGHSFSYSTELKCNWKIAVDAFSEAYHVDTIHGRTFPGARAYFDDIRLLGDHRVAALCATFSAKPTPVEELARQFTKASVVDNADKSGLPEKINPGRRDEFVNELSVLFPCLLLHVTKGIWFIHQFWPIDYNRTRWEGTYYVKAPESHSELWSIEYSQIRQRNAWLEDTATMEATHEAMESGAKAKMHLQDAEILVRHGYYVLERYLSAVAGD